MESYGCPSRLPFPSLEGMSALITVTQPACPSGPYHHFSTNACLA